MKINGIGNITKKEIKKELEQILTTEGRKALKAGEFTNEELAEMYKYNMVKKICKIGDLEDTFRSCYNQIPESLQEKLTPEELAELTEEFYNAKH